MDEELFVASGFGVVYLIVALIVAVTVGTWVPLLILGGIAAFFGAAAGFVHFMLWLHDKIF